MSDEAKGSRLPPPAFPPGSRKHLKTRTSGNGPDPSDGGDGYISPDDPMPKRRDAVESAFISPDDPLPDRDHEMDDAFISPDDPMPPHVDAADGDDGDEVGVVTGMDYDAHVEVEEMAAAGDPHVLELVQAVGKLADSLRHKGEAGLRIQPDMGRFEATLRGYCVGYLAGRRAEDDSSPDY